MLARTANLAAFVNPATRVAWLADHGDDHVVVVDVAKALLEAARLLEFHGEVRTMLLPHARSIGLLRQLLSLMPATEAELDALDTLVTIVQIDA